MSEKRPYEFAVQRPDGVIIRSEHPEQSVGYVLSGNADGLGRYRLLRRPVSEWQDITDLHEWTYIKDRDVYECRWCATVTVFIEDNATRCGKGSS